MLTLFAILAFCALIATIVHLAGKCGPCLGVAVLLLSIIAVLAHIPLGK